MFYRVVEYKDGKIYSLFHGRKGNREIPMGFWNMAVQKMVRDGSGGKYYPSGWHCFENYSDAENFFKSLKKKANRMIVPCEARYIRPKEGNRHNAVLACWIKISEIDVTTIAEIRKLGES